MPKYLEMEGQIVIDVSTILGQVKKPEKPEDDKTKEEKKEECHE